MLSPDSHCISFELVLEFSVYATLLQIVLDARCPNALDLIV